MKRFLSLILSLTLVAAISSPLVLAEDSAYDCGRWIDVPDSYMAALTEVCEYGIIQGYDELNFGFSRALSRAEAAVLGARFGIGASTYDSMDSIVESSAQFTDLPAVTEENVWALKGINYAYENSIMHGDGENGYPTTFRAFDTLNIPEAFKVFYESARVAGVLSSEGLAYSPAYVGGDLWYNEMLEMLTAENIIKEYNELSESFRVDSLDHFIGFSSNVQREDAALFFHAMIGSNLIDRSKIELRTPVPAPAIPVGSAAAPVGVEIVPPVDYAAPNGVLDGWDIRNIDGFTLHTSEGANVEQTKHRTEVFDATDPESLVFKTYSTDSDYSYVCCDFYSGPALSMEFSDYALQNVLDEAYFAAYDMKRVRLGTPTNTVGGLGMFDGVYFLRAEKRNEQVFLAPTVIVPIVGEYYGSYFEDYSIDYVTFTGPSLGVFEGGNDAELRTNVRIFTSYKLDSLAADLQARWDAFDYMIAHAVFR